LFSIFHKIGYQKLNLRVGNQEFIYRIFTFW